MPRCPICQTDSPEGAEVCTGCGAFRFRPPDAATPRPQSHTQAITPIDSRPLPDAEPDPDPEATSPPTAAEPELGVTPAMPDSPVPLSFRLVVVRGQLVNVEYPIREGRNFIGRTAEKLVDIDLTGQEPADQVWSSRQHAVITLVRGALMIEDLSSLNGTFVNRTRLTPKQPYPLSPNDVIGIGVVQLKVVT